MRTASGTTQLAMDWSTPAETARAQTAIATVRPATEPPTALHAVPLEMKRTVQSRAGGNLPAAPEVVWLSPAVPDAMPSLLDGLVA
jgi:hypothetical protein